MTAFAESLFALAALASGWIIVASWMRYGRKALALRHDLANCPETLSIRWKVIERVTFEVAPAVRKARAAHRAARTPARPGLAWPQMDLAA